MYILTCIARKSVAGLIAAALLGTTAAHAAERPADAAHRILKATGVQGGLVVLLGCGDGSLAVALRSNDRFLVHALDRDRDRVKSARRRVRKAGLYGPVSVESFAPPVLPYTDNLVNLLISDSLGDVPMKEVLRVLVPGGIAYIENDGRWAKTVKPRPDALDDWTHYLHSPSGNAVSHDLVVDVPRQYQWTGGPRYGRQHDHMSSTSAMVSAGGRLFAIADHASPFSIQLPSDWKLVARDAFNGTVLWRRDIGPWFSQLQRLKSGPSDLPRRLVAVGDTVYVTLALDAPVTALDAATGDVRTTYKGTKGADEILMTDGILYLVVNRMGFSSGPLTEWTPQERTVMAVNAETGVTLWERPWPWVVPGCLAVNSDHVVFFDGERVVALDRSSGGTVWQSDALAKRGPSPIYFSPTLVLYEDLVLFSGADPETKPYHADNGKTMYAFDDGTGKRLWSCPHAPSGYRSAEDILVVNGLVWTSDVFNSKEFRTEQTGTVWGRDPRTGEVKVEFPPDVETHWFHHRCYRAKATDKYLLTSRTGIEFVDVKAQHWTCNHWVRGACLYGIMPSNGMVYTPPHPCACYLEAKLYGFNALATHSSTRQSIIDTQQRATRLEQGPAYALPIEAAPARPTDWPTLRADAARSGCVEADVPTDLSVTWRAEIGGRLSSPVVADGRLFVAAIDAYEVHALDADNGKALWQFTTGARVDSPPTIWKGRVLFGSADGYVYCLRADDGRLIWRFRAAPATLKMGAYGRIESVWPVHGNVLVRESADRPAEVWCVAGRSMFLDGGMRLLRLNPITGATISETVLDDRVPGTDDNLQEALSGLNMPVALPDVLVSDNTSVYMRSQQFDGEGHRIDIQVPNLRERDQQGETAHLFSPTGMLDDVWWHRSYWLYGRVWKSGAGGYYRSGRFAPAGRPMVFDSDRVYSFGRKPQYYRWTTSMEYMLFATSKQPEIEGTGVDRRGKKNGGKKMGGKKKPSGLGAPPANTVKKQWARDIPLLVRAMVLADETLFLAGPPDLIDEPKTLSTFSSPQTQELLARQAAALEGNEGAVLYAVSTGKGEQLAVHKLGDLPVFDGMIASGQRLYFSSTGGRVVALGGRP